MHASKHIHIFYNCYIENFVVKLKTKNNFQIFHKRKLCICHVKMSHVKSMKIFLVLHFNTLKKEKQIN